MLIVVRACVALSRRCLSLSDLPAPSSPVCPFPIHAPSAGTDGPACRSKQIPDSSIEKSSSLLLQSDGLEIKDLP